MSIKRWRERRGGHTMQPNKSIRPPPVQRPASYLASHKDVCRLDVTVHDSRVVHVLYPRRNLEGGGGVPPLMGKRVTVNLDDEKRRETMRNDEKLSGLVSNPLLAHSYNSKACDRNDMNEEVATHARTHTHTHAHTHTHEQRTW